MKKLLTTLVVASLLAGSTMALSSCGEAAPLELALVTDVGDIDDHGFNQTSWEAVEAYGKKNNKGYAYYRPSADSKEERISSIEQAISKGAKVVVCPGFLFETAVYDLQDKYTDVKFILLDGAPHTDDYKTYKTGANVLSITYKEELPGFLAGYAAVKDGYTKLGFCGGMAVPAVVRFGYGFLQGVSAASDELNVNTQVKYHYAGAFQATDAATSKMKSWYTGGTEVVFGCGGKIYQSVKEGCKQNTKGKWIGVDADQVNDDATGVVLTSALKDLNASVLTALDLYYADKWSDVGTGNTWDLGLNSALGSAEKKDYVGLPTATASWNFKTFTKEQYDTILGKIKDGTIKVSNESDAEKYPTLSTKVDLVKE